MQVLAAAIGAGKANRVRGVTAVPRFFSLGEVAARLGGVQRRTVRRWVEAGEFPHAVRLPPRREGERGSYLVPESDVLAFCERRRWNALDAPNAPESTGRE